MNKKNYQRPKGFLGRIIKKIFKDNPVAITIIMVLTIASSLGMVLGIGNISALFDTHIPAIKNAVTDAEKAAANKAFYSYIYLLIVYFSVSTIAQLVSGLLSVLVSQKAMRDIRHITFSKMQYLPVKFFDTNKYGDIMSRYTNDVDTLDTFINQTLPNLVNVLTSVITYLIMMIINNIILTICVVVILTLIMTLSGTLLKKSTKHFYKRQQIIGRMNGYIEEMMGGTRVVQVFNHQEESIKDFDKIKEEYRQEEMKGNMIGNIVGPLNGNLVRIEYILIALKSLLSI